MREAYNMLLLIRDAIFYSFLITCFMCVILSFLFTEKKIIKESLTSMLKNMRFNVTLLFTKCQNIIINILSIIKVNHSIIFLNDFKKAFNSVNTIKSKEIKFDLRDLYLKIIKVNPI